MPGFDEFPMRDALRSIEYQRLKKCVYKAEWGTPQVEHFIYLQIQGRRRGHLGARFGIRNVSAEAFGIRSLKKYGSDLLRRLVRHDPKVDCSMNFDFAQLCQPLQPWRIYIPSHAPDEVAAIVKMTIVERLFPEIKKVTSLEAFLDLLLGDAPPCNWSPINGAIRAAHIVAVARQLGLRHDKIISSLHPYLKAIRVGLDCGDDQSAASYVDQLIHDWDEAVSSEMAGSG
jgi:hypothetical protein